MAAAETHETRRVLLINSFGREFAPWDAFAGSFRTELVRKFPRPPEIYEVSIEAARFGNSQEEPVVNYVRNLFDGRPLDLVIPIGGPAVRFAQKYRPQLFPEIPMLMAAADQRHIQASSLTSNDSVASVVIDLPGVIESILRVLPQTTNIFVVIGKSPLEQFWRETLQREFQPFTNQLAFVWWDDLPFPEMLKRSSALPPRSAIFYGMLAVDAAGVSHVEQRALTDLHATAAAPIFGVFSSQLGHGIVGGPLISIDDMSRRAVSSAERILRGESSANIRTAPQQAGAPMFDWRELRRWRISEASLSPGSVVMFREPSVWQQYKSRIIAIIVVVLVQTAIISFMLTSLIKRRRAEHSLAESEARFQTAANAAPVMIWMAGPDKLCTFFNKSWLEFTGRTLNQELGNGWTEGVHPDDFTACVRTYEESFDARREFAMEYRLRKQNGDYAWVLDKGTPRFAADGSFRGYVGSATDITPLKQAQERWRSVVEGAPNAMLVADADGKITLVNAQTEEVFGYTRAELIGHSVDMLVPETFRAQHPAHRQGYIAEPTTHIMGAGRELFGRRKDGSVVPLEIGLNLIRTPEGQFVLASINDITKRLAAEGKLRESEKRMTLAADAANLGMWIWQAPETYMWTSDKWKELHGYHLEEDIRFDALIERVHPDDREAVGRAVADAFKERGAFHIHHRLLLPNGTVRWISKSGRVEQMENDGSLRLMGISIDITERKEVEEAAREVSGKLITAQEDERCRIARDLHDDLNQRLAMLSVETDLLGRMANAAPAQSLISHIASHVHDLSSEVHKLSHQLHPAKLDQLGLVPATRSFCHELSKQWGMPVDFVHDVLPKDLSRPVALSLYRIIQEGLQNVVKHSGANRAWVILRLREGELTLAVFDNGRGFDVNAIRNCAGLGLVSMRERVRLVHGNFRFDSAPGRGTRIEVTVPLTLSDTVAT